MEIAPRYNEYGALIETDVNALAGAHIPAYGQRRGWRPSTTDDYADGGAYPEINMLQYPLDMGREKQGTSNALTIQVDAQGKVKYDAIARQGTAAKRIVHTSFSDLIPLRARASIGEISLARPSEETVAATTAKTKAAFDAILSGKAAAANAKTIANARASEPTYIRYTPSAMMGEAAGTQHRQRIIKLVDLAEDPMAPPKFKHTKVPRGPPSPPAPLLRSPPRKLTAKDQEDFMIPPSVSKWKNPKGYTIALDKRLAADGRGLEDVVINDNFAKLSEALFTAERHAREEVKQRAALQQRIADEEKEAKEEHLRMLARKVREQRRGWMPEERRRSASPVRGRTEAQSATPESRGRSYDSRDSRRSESYDSRYSRRSGSYDSRESRYSRRSRSYDSRSRSASRTPSSGRSRTRSRSASYDSRDDTHARPRSPSRTPSPQPPPRHGSHISSRRGDAS
ncbi:SKIP/SNW domain-containing protein [Limtongia smithiae]|uniref:SKIP/SNW domain-containing protein n=1 Tax=Limtongia smithiae TaxID=1125753 RepID=UPI0034CD0D4A